MELKRAVVRMIGMSTLSDIVSFLLKPSLDIYASDEDEDETAELLRELEKIKKERAEQRENEVFPMGLDRSKVEQTLMRNTQEREKAAEAEAQREHDIARGNPLLNAQDFHVKRRYVQAQSRSIGSKMC